MPSWAWYSLDDVEVHVDLTVVRERHVEDHALAVLAHEIGHHLLAPVDWASHVRIAARVQIGLVDLDHLVGLVSNLWCDLLINDRLQRQLGVDRAALSAAVGPPDPDDVLMLLVLRTNEILWGLPRGALVGDDPAPDDQALLCSRLVRAYSRDPVGGAAGFATLVRSTDPGRAAAGAAAAGGRRVRRPGGRRRVGAVRRRHGPDAGCARGPPVEGPARRRRRARRGDHPGRGAGRVGDPHRERPDAGGAARRAAGARLADHRGGGRRRLVPGARGPSPRAVPDPPPAPARPRSCWPGSSRGRSATTCPPSTGRAR